MTYKPQFDIDLRYGEAREEALVSVFLRSLVEVKSDRLCCQTGSIAIEYKQLNGDGKPALSGISVTDAHWYAIETPGLPCRWHLVPIEEMKKLTRRAIDMKLHKWIGDADEHLNALVPLAWLIQKEVPHGF